MHVVPFAECLNSGHRYAHLGPKPGQDQLPAAGSFHEVHKPLVLPCVDVRPIDRLLIWKYVLKTLDELSAASFEHRSQNDRNLEGLCELDESDHVVHDHRPLDTVKVHEL